MLKLNIQDENKLLSGRMLGLFKKIAVFAANEENIALPCFANVYIADDNCIHKINLSQRNIDSATDVLSFPSVKYEEGQTANASQNKISEEWDIDENAAFLGDIIISFEHAESQAKQYMHSTERELCYLLAHGLLHIMGYDHISEGEKNKMRKQEEKILKDAGIVSISDETLLSKARQALQNAYVPYSKYKVGACLLTANGKIYTGCNVENASYGLTNCAERTAVFKAVSDGETQFVAIAIAAEENAPWPCGACRQVLSEFARDMRVLVTWKDDNADRVEESTLKELLPHSFSPSDGVMDFLGGN